MKAYLPDQTHLSQVHLRTACLDRALEFYSGILGLTTACRPGPDTVLCAAGTTHGLVVLSQDSEPVRHPQRPAGLCHFALRYGRRQELARAVRGLAERDYPLEGASDHGVSEAIYIADPDGNGVELCADRPRATWSWRDGQVDMETKDLDLKNLLSAAGDESVSTETSAQVDIGHIHLCVADLGAAERFYSHFLGLAVTQRSYPGALFFGAGSYHHYIAVNTWADKRPRVSASSGLRAYRFEVPCPEILYCLGHRAPLLGYEGRTEREPDGGPILQIRDLNGTWLEVQAMSVSGSNDHEAGLHSSKESGRANHAGHSVESEDGLADARAGRRDPRSLRPGFPAATPPNIRAAAA